MSITAQALRIDEGPADRPGPASALDLSGLVFTWINTDERRSGGVDRFVVSEGEGELRVRGLGVGIEQDHDWGEVAALPFAPSPSDEHAWALNCSFDFGFLRTDVSAYNKQGILVAAIFNSFSDSSGRADYWTREFFHRETSPAAVAAAVVTEGGPTRARERLDGPAPGPIDLAPLLGSWVVFEPGTTGITRVDVGESGGAVSARAFGSADDGAPDWGEVPAAAFTDDVGADEGWAFRAGYDLGYARVELFGYLNRGVLAVDAGTRFTDGSGRSDYFTRELFYRR